MSRLSTKQRRSGAKRNALINEPRKYWSKMLREAYPFAEESRLQKAVERIIRGDAEKRDRRFLEEP